MISLVAVGGCTAVLCGLAAQQGIFSEENWKSIVVNGTSTDIFLDVRVSDTFFKRARGLSSTSELGPSEGMLFIHPFERSHTYVMRGMGFSLDIVFIDSSGTITEIYHDISPDDASIFDDLFPKSSDAACSGQAKYVLEVSSGWANREGVSVGDSVDIFSDRAVDSHEHNSGK